MFQIDSLTNELRFPLDIYYLISLLVPLAVCKTLTKFYDDSWHCNSLKLKYTDVTLYTSTTYKNLYQLSLKEGEIFIISYSTEKSLNINGYKACYSGEIYRTVLTFNGELFWTDCYRS
jgi:hypothetical protein